MFKDGDTVFIRGANDEAKILEIVDEGLVYVELNNGAEMEYAMKDLITREERDADMHAELEKKFHKVAHADTPVFANFKTTPKDIRAAHWTLQMLRTMAPDLILASINPDEIDPLKKIKQLSEKTGTPEVVWIGIGEMQNEGMLRQALAKTTLTNILEGTGLVGDMLLSNCKRTIKEFEKKNPNFEKEE